MICEFCGRSLPVTRFTPVCKCGGAAQVHQREDLPCVSRGDIVGVSDCGCAGKQPVHWCKLLNGHCTVHATGKPWSKLTDGQARIGKLLPCSACEHREVLPDLVTLEQPTILCDLPEPSSRRAIITVAPDEHTQAELQFTRKPMQDYARRFGYDFIEITDLTDQPHKCGNKYAYAEVASRYEQSLWLDTDVVIMPNAPNIFHQVPIDSWGLVDDLPGLKRKPNDFKWFDDQWKNLAKALGVQEYEVPYAWNSGVVVAPKDAQKSYHPPPKPVPDMWCVEQHYHTRCLLDDGAKVVNLSRDWNVGYWDASFTQHLASGHFIHLGACKPQKYRLQYLEHFANGNRTTLSELPIGQGWLPEWMLANHSAV